jgi:hypothetical protein
MDENGTEHKHKFLQDSIQENSCGIRRRRVVDIAAVKDLGDARNLLASGWEYKTSIPATISNIPHYILVCANILNLRDWVKLKFTSIFMRPSTILPRLSTKFASKSYKSTGVGLFISKGIIEAHGSKMGRK